MKTTRHLWAAILLVLALPAGAAAAGTKAYTLNADEVRLVHQFLPMLQAPLTGADRAALRKQLGSRSAAASALATVVLFRDDQKKYRAKLFEKFAVRDYDRRAKGQYVMIDKRELINTVRAIESHNGGVKDKRAYLLLSYLSFRDANRWVARKKRPLPVARIFRTAFLAAALKGADIDVLQLANGIDRWTRKQMGY